jgi:hypothetical protein
MEDTFDKSLAIIIGIMSFMIVLYRIIDLMIPMIKRGIKTNNLGLIMSSLSLLV